MVDEVVEEIIGDKSEAHPDFGGVQFERLANAASVKPGARVYSTGPTHQRAPNISSPTAAGKHTTSDYNRSIRQKIATVRRHPHVMVQYDRSIV